MITPSPNIWNFSWTTLLAWTAAYAIWEPISYFVIPKIFKASTTQEYYTHSKFPFSIVAFGDYIYSTFLLLVSQQVITSFAGTTAPQSWGSWFARFAGFVGVQWAGDLTFWQIIQRVPLKNKYVDFFQRYGKDVGIGAPIGDSLYGLVWFLTTQVVAGSVPTWLQVTLITLFMFGTLVVSY
jgi:hypothetical protein